jgi:Raf kinase inhibitor-like YbhB/YbcL family protein
MDDPDAVSVVGYTWVHWNAYNIPASAAQVVEGATNRTDLLPVGTVEGVSSFGSSGYRGPCPPSGSHHYHYAVYALNKASITMSTPSTRDQFETVHVADIIQKAELTGYFR